MYYSLYNIIECMTENSQNQAKILVSAHLARLGIGWRVGVIHDF